MSGLGRHEVTRLDEIFDDPARADHDPLLSVQGVNVNFGGIAALTDVTLCVGPHELVSLIGPNGAGKTTTLNAICRIISSTGEITFKGRPISRMSGSQVAAAGVGRSFQDPPLLEHHTVLENIMCGAHRRMQYRMIDQVLRRRKVETLEREMTRRAMVLLDFVGLARHATDPVGQLPYGARKLIDIARATVAGPQLLLLDEPSSGLDAQERASLQAMLLVLREAERVGILMVEHHMDLVRAVSTQVVALQAGRVVMSGSPNEVLDSDLFRAVVVGATSADDREPFTAAVELRQGD